MPLPDQSTYPEFDRPEEITVVAMQCGGGGPPGLTIADLGWPERWSKLISLVEGHCQPVSAILSDARRAVRIGSEISARAR